MVDRKHFAYYLISIFLGIVFTVCLTPLVLFFGGTWVCLATQTTPTLLGSTPLKHNKFNLPFNVKLGDGPLEK